MKTKNTLCIAEWQSFGIDEIKQVFNSQDKDEKIFKKIFDELSDFAKGNDRFLKFYSKDKLQAKNFVGLIQTKSGFCLEILPKIVNKNNLDKCTCNGKIKAKINEDKIKEFVESSLDSSNKTFEYQLESNCEICEAKNILFNCLKTLKNSPFKKSNFSNLNIAKMPILEVFINMFLDELNILVNRGIKHDYKTESKNRNFLKGKLEFNQNIKYNFVHKERFFSSADEFVSDIAPNRLIKSTLILLSRQNLGTTTSARLNQMRFIFDSINESKNIDNDFNKCQQGRSLKSYELILTWCSVFLKKSSFINYSGDSKSFALLFDMNVLFESFVAHCFKKFASKEYKIFIQSSKKFLISCSESGNLFQLKPDMIAESKQDLIIMDTKWKNLDSSSSNDERQNGVSQSDLYQMFAYALKYKNTESKKVKVILIYPLSLSQLTQDLKKEWDNKTWSFKACKDIEISLKFFPIK